MCVGGEGGAEGLLNKGAVSFTTDLPQKRAAGLCAGREENCFAGGEMARKPICPTPPSPSLVALPGGGFGLALPFLLCRGGGGGSDPNIHGSK